MAVMNHRGNVRFVIIKFHLSLVNPSGCFNLPFKPGRLSE